MSGTKQPSLKQIEKQLESWSETIKNSPIWYKTVVPTLIKWEKQYSEHPDKDRVKELVYGYFQDKLDNNEIFLDKDGPNLDVGRKKIDTVVIHHTSRPSGVTWQTLSAIAFVRLYAKDFCLYDDQFGIKTKDLPIWSGHFRDDKQVFYAYHWLVRMDGSFERLLEDKYVGWQAGNTEVNVKSIAIVLDGELTDVEPTNEALIAIAKILKENYPKIIKERIMGHLEVNPKTICPGELFLPSWKHKLLSKIF